jgi:hypothetical protein
MPSFTQQGIPVSDVEQLRIGGMTDNDIVEQLMRKGYSPDQVHAAITQLDEGGGNMVDTNYSSGFQMNSAPMAPGQMMGQLGGGVAGGGAGSGDNGGDALYGRMEELVEKMIDEKWDELISEVKKIIEWKEKVEVRQVKMEGDLAKLKEDFTLLHQGVLGKLEDYDGRMREVDTELKAVGKVFKDTIPTFVENVKELSSVTEKLKK